jgi:hypothetical protein
VRTTILLCISIALLNTLSTFAIPILHLKSNGRLHGSKMNGDMRGVCYHPQMHLRVLSNMTTKMATLLLISDEQCVPSDGFWPLSHIVLEDKFVADMDVLVALFVLCPPPVRLLLRRRPLSMLHGRVIQPKRERTGVCGGSQHRCG